MNYRKRTKKQSKKKQKKTRNYAWIGIDTDRLVWFDEDICNNIYWWKGQAQMRPVWGIPLYICTGWWNLIRYFLFFFFSFLFSYSFFFNFFFYKNYFQSRVSCNIFETKLNRLCNLWTLVLDCCNEDVRRCNTLWCALLPYGGVVVHLFDQ